MVGSIFLALAMAVLSGMFTYAVSSENKQSTENINQKLIESNEKINQQQLDAAANASALDYQRNSYSSQVAQLKQAGLNPQLLSGSSFQPSATQTPALHQLSGLRVPTMENPASNSAGIVQNVMSAIDNHNLSEKQALLTDANVSKVFAEITKLHKDGNISDAQYAYWQKRISNMQREQDDAHEVSQSVVKKNLSSVALDSSQIALNEKTLARVDSEIKLNASKAGLTDAQTQAVYAETNQKLPLLLEELRESIRNKHLTNEQLAALNPKEYGSLLSQKLVSQIASIDATTAKIVQNSLEDSEEHELKMLSDMIEFVTSDSYLNKGTPEGLANPLQYRYSRYFDEKYGDKK